MHHAMMRPPSEEMAGGLFDKVETAGPDFRTVLAACVMTGGRPMIIGFMAHPMTQMEFIKDEQNRDIYRHPAGNNINTERHGNYEIHHTGGAFIKVGKEVTNAAGVLVEADRHEDLTPLCANENWIYPLNDPVVITLVTGDQGENAFKERVRETGDTDIMSSGYLHVRYAKDAHVDIGETTDWHSVLEIRISSGGDIKIRTPANVTISAGENATLQALGDVNIYAGGNINAAAAGDATIEAGGNVTAAAAGDAAVAAGGSVEAVSAGPLYAGGAGPVFVGASDLLVLDAPTILVNCEEMIVTGEIIEGGAEGGLLGGLVGGVTEIVSGIADAIGIDLSYTLGAPGDIGGQMGDAAGDYGSDAAAAGDAAASAAQPEVDAAIADIEEAQESIRLAVEEAVETSLEAVGTGDPDNEGITSDPAGDVP
jgi:hypothetical protein